jgi:hypothetical protein
MATFKKKQLDELVGGDFTSSGGDRNVTNNSEIETGPVQKDFKDNSYYEKNVSTTTDRVFARYRQNIPWFAVYSFGGSRTGGIPINYGLNEDDSEENNKNVVMTKKAVEEKIEDLVKKSKSSDINSKDYNPKVEKVLDEISELDLSEKQIEELLKALEDKKNNPSKTKNI